MEILKAILLGILQGVSEFLPISSSGHIVLFAHFMNGENQEENLFLTVALHLATALSILVVYRKHLYRIFFTKGESSSFLLKIAFSMIPAVLLGVFFSENIKEYFSHSAQLVGFMLCINGCILLFSHYVKNRGKDISFGNAFLIGIAQAIAIIPGISRSGSTISTALYLGIKREHIVTFSFFMVIPIIFGAIAKESLDYMTSDVVLQFDPKFLAVSFVSAFISGIFACKFVILLVNKRTLHYFAYYCFVVGILSILFT